MPVKRLETAEDVFEHLKRYDPKFREMKEGSEHRTWNDFKIDMLSRDKFVKWLESRVDECNQQKSDNISRGQKESEASKKAQKKLSKIGTKNFKKAHSDSEHQKKAGAKGKETTRKINAERFDKFMSIMMEELPNEFSHSDLEKIRIKHKNNTVFHTTHKSNKLISSGSVQRRFLENAKKMNLIVMIRSGNQYGPTVFHKINSIDILHLNQKEEQSHTYIECLEYAFGI